MENIHPFLVAGALFVYQIYANYQKEQEKARKRNPSQRPQAEFVDEPFPHADDPFSRGDDPYSPADEYYPAMEETVPEQALSRKSKQEANLYERWNSTDVPEEVLKMRQYRAAKKEKELLSTAPLEVEIVDDDADFMQGGFDLREAVIQAAVLERPYA